MTPPTRHFIGKDKAAPELIVRWCRRQWRDALPQGLIFCVPTALAFRRLRDALTVEYGAFHGVHFIQPSGLLTLFSEPSKLPIATPSELLCIWDEVFDWLVGIDPEHLIAQHLFPGKREWLQRPRARHAIAQRLTKLRATLIEQKLTFGDVARHSATAHLDEHEQARWGALDALETRFHEALARHKLVDPLDRQLEILRSPVAQPQETGADWHLVVACVPDIMPALTELFAAAPHCSILIQADPEDAETFDSHGCPLPAAWANAPIALPEQSLHIAETPNDEAIALDTFLRTHGTVKPSQLCLAILDHAIVPTFTSLLTDHGVSIFAPEPLSLADQHPAQAILSLLTLLSQPDIAHVLPLFAHKAVVDAVQTDYTTLRTAYHTLMEDARPQTLAEAVHHLKAPNPPPTALALYSFLVQCQAWLNALKEDLIGGVRTFLTHVYGAQLADPARDPILLATFEALRDLLNELSALRLDTAHAPTPELLQTRLNEISLRPVRLGADCSYEGRLEILWSSAPILLMAGLNEGLYPDTTFEDFFLPNRFRRALGLRSDENRVARDAYILSLATAQRTPENLCLLCARTNRQGDWLKPSRLLFRCDSEAQAHRADKFFLQAPPHTAPLKTESALAFDTNPIAWRNNPPRPTRLSASSIRDFLQSPLNYWLRRTLNLADAEAYTGEVSAATFGTLLHDILTHLPHCNGESAETLSASLTARLYDTLLERYGNNPDIEVVATRYDAEARLKSMAPLEIMLRQDGWETRYIEEQTRDWTVPLTVDGHTLLLNGQIDRIDYNPSSGVWRIIDYKTGKKGEPPNEKHYKLNKADNSVTWLEFQLPIYRLIVRQALNLTPETPIELAYITLPADDKAQLHTYRDPIDEAATFCDLLATLSQILALGSTPLPADVGTYGDPLLADLVRPTLPTENELS